MDERKLKNKVDDLNDQVADIANYLCSRGDSITLRDQVEIRARTMLHALAQRGWIVTRKAAENEADNGPQG